MSAEPRERKVGLRDTARLSFWTSALVLRASPRLCVGLAALTVASAAIPPAIAWVGKEIVDAVVAHDHDRTLKWVLVELAVTFGYVVAQRLLGLVRTLLGESVSHELSVAILEKSLHLELRHFEDGKFYDSLTRARQGAAWRPLQVVAAAFLIIQNVLTLLGYVALIVAYSPWAAVILLGAALPAALIELRYARTAFRVRDWRAPDTRRLKYLEWLITSNEHVKEHRLFRTGPFFLDRYRDLSLRFLHEDGRVAIRRSLAVLALSLVATGAFYGCYVGVALAAAAGTITLGAMTLYLVAFRQGQQSFQSALAELGDIHENVLYMSSLHDYLAMDLGDEARAPAAPRAEEGLRFENVGFRYPAANGSGEEKWALRGIDLFVPRGQSVALVGENGAGKTTIVKLLTRLYAPTEGRVLLDGKDLRDWEETALRARLSVIFQDFGRYELDVRENVALGSLDHRQDDGRLARAVERGGADKVVANLGDGLATKLGKWAHDGISLSGGEWQKIALSRAFMREEADVLVLDEPTASLDAKAEHEVFQRFRELTRGRTSVLISHRFSTVRMADRIVVLEHGRVIEDGSHEELMARGGRYAEMFTLQAEAYR